MDEDFDVKVFAGELVQRAVARSDVSQFKVSDLMTAQETKYLGRRMCAISFQFFHLIKGNQSFQKVSAGTYVKIGGGPLVTKTKSRIVMEM